MVGTERKKEIMLAAVAAQLPTVTVAKTTSTTTAGAASNDDTMIVEACVSNAGTIHTLYAYPGQSDFFDHYEDDDEEGAEDRGFQLQRSSNDVANFVSIAFQLKKLSIGDIEMHRSPTINNLLLAAGKSCCLQTLLLENVMFDRPSFCQMMKETCSLRHLKLAWIWEGAIHMTNGGSWKELANSLQSCTQLERVEVDQCYIPELYSAVITGLVRHQSLQDLNVHYGFDDDGTDEGGLLENDFKRIALVLQTCPRLFKLHVGFGYDQSGASIRPLIHGLGKAPSLKHLSLAAFDMTVWDSELVAQYLAKDKSLTKVTLSGAFGSAFASREASSRIVLKGLQRNQSITDVELFEGMYSSNHRYGGMENVKLLLQEKKNLVRLSLSGPGWGSNPGLVKGFGSHQALQKLILTAFYKKPDSGMADILSWVGGAGSAVEFLDLSNNGIGHSDMKALCQLVMHTKGPLRKLRMERMGMPEVRSSRDKQAIEFRTLLQSALKSNMVGLYEIKVTVHVWGTSITIASTDFCCRRNRWNVLSKSLPDDMLSLASHNIASLKDPSLIFHALRGPVLMPSLLRRSDSAQPKQSSTPTLETAEPTVTPWRDIKPFASQTMSSPATFATQGPTEPAPLKQQGMAPMSGESMLAPTNPGFTTAFASQTAGVPTSATLAPTSVVANPDKAKTRIAPISSKLAPGDTTDLTNQPTSNLRYSPTLAGSDTAKTNAKPGMWRVRGLVWTLVDWLCLYCFWLLQLPEKKCSCKSQLGEMI